MSDYVLNIAGKDDDNLCPSLSFKQRIIGFVICLAGAAFLSFIGFYCLFQSQYVEFGIFNTLANIGALSSSFFLAGPKKQAKKMFEETRIIASIVYLISMILTFIMALVVKLPGVVLLFVFIQYLAMIWYGLSYIPGARNCIKRIVGLPTS
jgi:hypothetical protein